MTPQSFVIKLITGHYLVTQDVTLFQYVYHICKSYTNQQIYNSMTLGNKIDQILMQITG